MSRPLLFFFSFPLVDGIVNFSMLICIFLCGCNLNNVNRNLFEYLVFCSVFKSNLLTFCSVFVLYSLFKCEKLITAIKLQKKLQKRKGNWEKLTFAKTSGTVSGDRENKLAD